MKLSREQTELEYLKAKADELDNKITIYGDQFGPLDDVVLRLKNELNKVNALILDLMVQEQENRINSAIIA